MGGQQQPDKPQSLVRPQCRPTPSAGGLWGKGPWKWEEEDVQTPSPVSNDFGRRMRGCQGTLRGGSVLE